jgi:hypothetical protein
MDMSDFVKGLPSIFDEAITVQIRRVYDYRALVDIQASFLVDYIDDDDILYDIAEAQVDAMLRATPEVLPFICYDTWSDREYPEAWEQDSDEEE